MNVNSGMNIEEYYANNATFTNNQNVGTYAEQVDLSEIFVNPASQDYRVKADSGYASLGVLNEDFNIDSIGIQNEFELTEETASFEKLYPAKNACLDYQDEYNFTWSPALGANNYKLTIATDKKFENVVFEKETIQTGAVVTGLLDNTTYYWKVEAENISRDLKNTWTSIDGVTSFGINVSQYEDTVAEMPENLTSGADKPNSAHYGALSDSDELAQGAVGDAIKVYIENDRTNSCDSTWYASGIWLKDKNSTASDKRFRPEANTSYVFSIRAKSIEGNTKVGLANNKYYNQYTVADHDVAGVQLGTEWTDFKTTLSTEDTTTYQHNFLVFGIVSGTARDYIIYDSSSPYLAKEVAYEIGFTGGKVLGKKSSLEIDADVLNQIGTKYSKATNNYSWVVVDSERKNEVKGFKVTPTEADASKVTIEVSDDVSEGKYVLVAENDGLKKGFEFEVISGFEDTPAPQMPENLTSGADRTNSAHYGALSDSDELAQGAVGDAIKVYIDNDRPDSCDSTWYASGIWLKDKNSTASDKRFRPEANTSYVFSIRAKSVEGNTKVGLANNKYYGQYIVADHDRAGVQLGIEWTDFKTTLSTEDTTTYQHNFLTFGIVSGTAADYIIYDSASPYLAEEIAYSMNITADNTTLTPIDEINVSAEVLNQIGTKGNLSQDVEWYVVTADRTTIVENVKVEKTDEGATISLEGAISFGDYALVAVADDLVKGIEINVVSSFADTETPQMPANLTSGADKTNSAKYAALSDSDELAQGAVGDAIKVYIENDRTDSCDSTWYASGIWLRDKNKDASYSDRRFKPEANKNYVFSIRAKSVEGNTKVGLANNKYYNQYNVANHDRAGVQLGTEWTDFKTTLSTEDTTTYQHNFLTFGIVSGTARDYIIYDNASPYLAEEIAYSINITGENEIAVGEDAVISAELLNQIGTKGNLSQEFDWSVLNADRSDYADGITLVKNADSTVTVTGTDAGEYTVIAMAKDSGFIKGFTLTVSAEETPVEKIASAVFGKTGNAVNFKATVENTDADKVLFVIAEFNGKTLVQTVKSDIKSADDADCDLTLENVVAGNTVRAFIWNEGTLFPIDNPDNLELEYIITAQ